MKTLISDMKSTVDGVNRRQDTTEEIIIEPEDVTIEMIQNETERIKTGKNKKNISEFRET